MVIPTLAGTKEFICEDMLMPRPRLAVTELPPILLMCKVALVFVAKRLVVWIAQFLCTLMNDIIIMKYRVIGYGPNSAN